MYIIMRIVLSTSLGVLSSLLPPGVVIFPLLGRRGNLFRASVCVSNVPIGLFVKMRAYECGECRIVSGHEH